MPSPTPLPSGPRHYPRLKFVWGSSEVIDAHWHVGLFGFYTRIHGYRFSGLAISMRGLLRWTLVLGVVGYLSAAFALTWWLQRNPYNQLHYVDVLTWPGRRAQVAELRGRGWLAQGKAAIAAQRWWEAVYYLRRGLEVCPDDADARLALSQFYLLSGQRVRALALMVDGASHAVPSRATIEAEFAVIFAGEDWTSGLTLCDRALAQLQQPERHGLRQFVLGRKLAILLELKRPTEALALAPAEGDRATLPVQLQHARALAALGRVDEALALLRRARAGLDADEASGALRIEIVMLREAGRLDAMDRALEELRVLHPNLPQPLAFAVEQKALATRGAPAALENFLFRFGNNPANLQLVAQPLARIPDVALLQRVIAAAQERGFPRRPFLAQLAEAQVRRSDWPAVNALVDELAPLFAQAKPEARVWFDWVRMLGGSMSAAANSDAAVTIHFQQRLLSLDAYRIWIDALRHAGRDDQAREVIAIARQLYAESPWLIAQQAEVEAAIHARPPPTAPVATTENAPALSFATAEEYLAEIDRLIAAERLTDAAAMLDAARSARPAPGWLTARDADVLRREIRIAQKQHRTADLRTLARLYLNGSPARGRDMFALAQEWDKAGARDDALQLMTWTVEKTPDFELARKALREWKAAK